MSRPLELRCENKLHGIVLVSTGSSVIEFKCDSRFCGASKGVVVLHRFDVTSSKLTYETRKFRDPGRR